MYSVIYMTTGISLTAEIRLIMCALMLKSVFRAACFFIFALVLTGPLQRFDAGERLSVEVAVWVQTDG